MAANPRLVTIRELATILGVSRETILRQRKTHPLYSKAIQLGARTSPLRWYREDVEAYLAELRGDAAA